MSGAPPATPATVVVDASVWTARFLARDIHHARSRAWLEAHLAADGPVFAPTLLLAEVGGSLARRTGRKTLASRVVHDLLRLQTLRLVNVTEQLGALAAQLAIDLQLRGADAVYVAVAEYLNVPLVTWDREQLTRAVNRITVRTP